MFYKYISLQLNWITSAIICLTIDLESKSREIKWSPYRNGHGLNLGRVYQNLSQNFYHPPISDIITSWFLWSASSHQICHKHWFLVVRFYQSMFVCTIFMLSLLIFYQLLLNLTELLCLNRSRCSSLVGIHYHSQNITQSVN